MNALQPKVSVVVPVYRVEQYLDRCMQSLLTQTLREIEIVLVDDGSPDLCPQMCDAYAAQDDRVRVYHKQNNGLGMARNDGMDRATGEYVTFVDSDDYVAPDMCERMYQAAKEHDADLVLAGMNTVGGIIIAKEEDVATLHCLSETELFLGAEGRKKLTQGFIGAHPAEKEDSRYGYSVCKNLYRRETIVKNGVRFHSERQVVLEDIIFQLDFVPFVERAVGIPGAFLYYCRNGASLSKGYREDRFERSMLSIQFMKEHMPRSLSAAEYQPFLDRQIQAQARVASIQEVLHAKDCGVPARTLYARLRKINKSPELAPVLRRFPWYRLPLMQAAFAFTMRFNLPVLARVLVELKERK